MAKRLKKGDQRDIPKEPHDSMHLRLIDTTLIGLGNVGRNFLRILETKHQRIASQYGLEFRIVCVADSSGVAVDPDGFSPLALRTMKEAGGHLRGLAGYLPDHTPAEALAMLECDLLLEASPVNLRTGEPGLSATRIALQRGISVVLANKGPLVLAFRELHELAHRSGARLAFSATVCGALPVINIGRRDLIAADITLLRGVFNSTSNFILAEMAIGRSFADALSEAQRRGIAESDPSLDVDGWDTANKLVIIANSLLRLDAALTDVSITGIAGAVSYTHLLDGRDLVREVTCQETYNWVDGTRVEWTPVSSDRNQPVPISGQASSADEQFVTPLVVAYDFGIKHNILRRLTSHDLRVTVVPANTPASDVLALNPDGVFLSNGPGDPAGVPYAAEAVRDLLDSRLPIFGICLGHQIIGLALGARTYKLKFGHHGGNQPVSDIDSPNVQITAQNHNYAVDAATLPANVEVTHRNLNDGTVEGLRLMDRPVFCVQYHPEASPGPHDADLLFARFAAMVKGHAAKQQPPEKMSKQTMPERQ